jgi:hypothetical protein
MAMFLLTSHDPSLRADGMRRLSAQDDKYFWGGPCAGNQSEKIAGAKQKRLWIVPKPLKLNRL